ncbi:hypothetical protein ECG_00222 [Echinococcus granulosus]|uniref:Uncharacterized protein n=1 Tax=Echinococcus granulosus TaxID=6210 RepID=A0A068WY54_ECHGR|nr:hypothetical protein ECG_00222 [Echinococcus granulosus]CDS22624.1 hypothetical protein EgrG_002032400 [Echinococcus granulosus]
MSAQRRWTTQTCGEQHSKICYQRAGSPGHHGACKVNLSKRKTSNEESHTIEVSKPQCIRFRAEHARSPTCANTDILARETNPSPIDFSAGMKATEDPSAQHLHRLQIFGVDVNWRISHERVQKAPRDIRNFNRTNRSPKRVLSEPNCSGVCDTYQTKYAAQELFKNLSAYLGYATHHMVTSPQYMKMG